MTSWLSKQRKQTLLDLSNEAGLSANDDLRKDELIDKLDTHLLANQTRLSRNASFEPYYGTRRTPGKPRASSSALPGASSDADADGKSVVRVKSRKSTKVKAETDEEEAGASSPSQTIAAVTNAVTSKLPSLPKVRRRSELPASPADVADDIEYATTRLYSGLDELYARLGFTEAIEHVREQCSSVTAVQLSFLLFEAIGLQREILPWRYAFDIPAIKLLGTRAIGVHLPDLFMLLTGHFWSTSLLWAATSVFVPGVFGYFYNLSARTVKRHGSRTVVARYESDPLTFNIVKGLLTWIVYAHNYTFGLFSTRAAYTVDHAIIGGYNSIIIGCYVGILAALYEAAQRK